MENYNSEDKIYMDLPVGQIVHYFLLMSEKGWTSEAALKEVHEKKYDELDKITHANDYIMNVLHITEKILFKGFTVSGPMKEIIRGDVDEIGTYFLESVGGEIFENNMEGEIIFEKMLDINEEFFKQRILKLTKSNPQNKKSLFPLQYLTHELIGVEELSKNFMYIAPLFDKFSLPVGGMQEVPYGKFETNDTIVTAYKKRVLKFLEKNNISTKDDLKDYIKNGISNSLRAEQKMTSAEIDVLTSNEQIEKIVNQVISNNPKAFKKFIEQTQI